jgi:hypothetical protein
MTDVSRYRHYAADCMRRADEEQSPDDRNILLNVALAWIRLADQLQDASEPVPSPPEPPICANPPEPPIRADAWI